MYMGSSSSSACNINYTTLTSSFSDKVHRCTGQSGAPTGPLFNPGDSLMIGGTQPANPLTTGDGDLVIRILYREHTFGQ